MWKNAAFSLDSVAVGKHLIVSGVLQPFLPMMCDKTTLVRILAFILLLPAAVLGAPSAPSATWLYPDPSATPTFNYIDTLNVSWQTNYPNAYLALWCGIPDLSNINLCAYPKIPIISLQLTSHI